MYVNLCMKYLTSSLRYWGVVNIAEILKMVSIHSFFFTLFGDNPDIPVSLNDYNLAMLWLWPNQPLIYCGLVTPYRDIYLGQYCLE